VEIVLTLVGIVLLTAGLAAISWSIFGQPGTPKRAALVSGILLILLGASAEAVRVVPAGSVGVVKHWGAVDSNEIGPGISLVLPFATDIVVVDTRVQGIKFEKLGAASREYQDVFLTGTLNVHVDPHGAAELYQNIGLDYSEKVVVPFYSNIVKEIVPRFGIAEVLPQRENIRIQTVQKLAEKLNPLGIIVDDVALSNVDFNDEYSAAIKDKQVQELKIATERNILEQKKVIAEQAAAEAHGQAEAQVERARGEAESNRLVGASLTQAILNNRYIEKLGDKVQVIYLPTDTTTLLPLPQVSPQP
jgi:regulator of protease activity HflC (stomatin/prohibitin superfamily)